MSEGAVDLDGNLITADSVKEVNIIAIYLAYLSSWCNILYSLGFVYEFFLCSVNVFAQLLSCPLLAGIAFWQLTYICLHT